jgi:N-acyl-D-aspartate/D-glutamate deacylase
MLDLLIRNALVFDGSGTEPAVKDVAIQHGKI